MLTNEIRYWMAIGVDNSQHHFPFVILSKMVAESTIISEI